MKKDIPKKITRREILGLSILGLASAYGTLRCFDVLDNNFIEFLRKRFGDSLHSLGNDLDKSLYRMADNNFLKKRVNQVKQRMNNLNSCSALYEISKFEDFKYMRKDLDRHYVLSNDINCYNKDFEPIGTDCNPFTGIFDGNGYTLSNLKIKGKSFVGMFGFVKSVYDKDISIIANVNLENIVVKGDSSCGCLIGYNHWGNIVNCHIKGEISGNQCIGGVIGKNYDGIILDSSAKVKVNGNSYCGGLIGMHSGFIENCKSESEVIANEYSGKFIGG